MLVPYGGKSLLDHALTELASSGFTHVQLYLSDRPEAVRQQVGKGEKWGLELAFHPTHTEPTPEELRSQLESSDQPVQIYTLDRIPLTHPNSLFSDYATWFQSLVDYLPVTAALQMGMEEQEAGIWVGIGSQIAPGVKITPPCWVGRNVLVADRAQIGPNAIIEDQCFIDERARIRDSQIGQRTYVGPDTDVVNSFAWGARLLNWKTGNGLEIQDRFLLARLGADPSSAKSFTTPLRQRAAAILMLILASPLLVITILLLKLRGKAPFILHTAARPSTLAGEGPTGTFQFRDLNVSGHRLRRLPRLWSIIRGQMHWVGNPPIPPKATEHLETEFDQLWLAAPCGLASLGDCYACIDPSDSDARAHAAYFAVQPNAVIRRQVLTWLFFGK